MSSGKPELRIHPATAARWDDLASLFGKRGACGGCWCMAWRLPKRTWLAGKTGANKRALHRLVSRRPAPGVLGYSGREPVAWCAVAPRKSYVALASSRVLKPVDEQPVWSISCLFVRKDQRRRGLSVEMLRGAVAYAAGQGARIVEGYPIEPTMEQTPDPFVWTGTPSAFRKAGFLEVARRSRTRSILRAYPGAD